MNEIFELCFDTKYVILKNEQLGEITAVTLDLRKGGKVRHGMIKMAEHSSGLTSGKQSDLDY